MELKDKEEKKKAIPLGAWLPRLPLLILGFMAVTRANGLGGGLVPLAFYLPVSFLLGAIVVFLYRKNRAAKNVAALILFGGPAFALMIEQTESRYRVSSAKAAQEMLREYCAEQAGSVVYRTAKDVEGVLQMEYREDYSLENASRDDVPDPWYQSSLDHLRSGLVGPYGEGYYFYERKTPSYDGDTAILRTFLVPADEHRQEKGKQTRYVLEEKEALEDLARSKYGWRSQNLTTKKMRKRWLTGGTIEIIDLRSGDVMGELTSFFIGLGAFSKEKAWKPNPSPENGCSGVPTFTGFIRTVLEPAREPPSATLIEELTNE